MKVLITGIAGFAGSHLADYCLAQKGVTVFGFHRTGTSLENLSHLGRRLQLEKCDLLNGARVASLVKKIRPHRVFHLAGEASAVSSAGQTLQNNIFGGLNILEAVRGVRGARLLVVGSAQEYGERHGCRTPIREPASLEPLNPYGISKTALSFLTAHYFKDFGVQAVRTRSFNHTGPRQKDHFAPSDFAKQVALIERGRQSPEIRTGDLGPVRDFCDVRDVARAYWLLLEKGESGAVYNVCSGRAVKIRRLLDIYLAKSRVKFRILPQASRFRAREAEGLVGDPGLIRRTTGWRPEIPLEQTLSDLLDYWRDKIDC